MFRVIVSVCMFDLFFFKKVAFIHYRYAARQKIRSRRRRQTAGEAGRRAVSGLLHKAVGQEDSAAFDSLAVDDAIAPSRKKGLGRQRSIGGEGARVAVSLQNIAQCRCDPLPLIILMDIEPVEVACRVHIRKADYLSVSQRHKTVMRREAGVPALAAYA